MVVRNGASLIFHRYFLIKICAKPEVCKHLHIHAALVTCVVLVLLRFIEVSYAFSVRMLV